MKRILENTKVYICAIMLIIIDQITKVLVLQNKNIFPKQIIKGLLKFNYCENRGVAFSLGEGNVALFILLNIVLISVLIIYYEKNKSEFNLIGRIFISMTISGGISNLLDRAFRGFVVDFIDISDLFSFAIFNVADILITVGVFGIAICYIVKAYKK